MLSIPKACRINNSVLRSLIGLIVEDPSSIPFNAAEMSKAIKSMKVKGAPGKDKIHKRFIKAMGPIVSSFMLRIFIDSWKTGSCRASWREAIIVPILKKGKPASQIDSFRPVSLTSCVAKNYGENGGKPPLLHGEVWSQYKDKLKAHYAVQKAVVTFGLWSADHKLSLNPAKCEVEFFSTDTAEAKWSPSSTLNGHAFAFNYTPTFLGVMLDRTLTFRPQAEAVKARALGRVRILSALVSKEWGWGRRNLRTIYMATVHSVLHY